MLLRRQPVGEPPNGVHVVIGADVLARTGDRHRVQNGEEVHRQPGQQRGHRPLLRRQFRPGRELDLGLAEHFRDRRGLLQTGIDPRGVALVGEFQLVSEIGKAVIDRRRRQHQHLGRNAAADHLVHEPRIAVHLDGAVLILLRMSAVAEIMRLVDDHQAVVLPVDHRKIDAVRLSGPTRKVGMVENGVAEPVRHQRIVAVIGAVGVPVVRQLLGTQHQYALVPLLVILDDGEGRKGLAESDRISEDASVELLKLVDDRKRGVLLEVVKHVPDLRLLEADRIVRENILVDVLNELGEDIVERQVIHEFRRILAIRGGNRGQDLVRDVLHLLRIVPDRIERRKELPCFRRTLLDDEVRDVVTAFRAKPNGREFRHGEIRFGRILSAI